MEDLRWARGHYRQVERIFLADGDVLVLKTDYLLRLLDAVHALFPECTRVSSYGTARNILRKTPRELALLRAHGLEMVYLGAETGNQEILRSVRKGCSREELIEAVHKIADAGMRSSVTFISGLGGRARWREHAMDTGTIISEMEPDYAGLLTLMLHPGPPLYEDVKRGAFELLTPGRCCRKQSFCWDISTEENLRIPQQSRLQLSCPARESARGQGRPDRAVVLCRSPPARWLRML